MGEMTREQAIEFVRGIPRRAEHEWSESWAVEVDAALAIITAPPKVELVTYRDPDSAIDVGVFVDGVETHGYHHTSIDPGAGHSLSGWLDTRRSFIEGASPAAGELIGKWMDAGAGSSYVEDDSPWFITMATTAPRLGGHVSWSVLRRDYGPAHDGGPWTQRRVKTGLSQDEAQAYVARLQAVALATGVWGQ